MATTDNPKPLTEEELQAQGEEDAGNLTSAELEILTIGHLATIDGVSEHDVLAQLVSKELIRVQRNQTGKVLWWVTLRGMRAALIAQRRMPK